MRWPEADVRAVLLLHRQLSHETGKGDRRRYWQAVNVNEGPRLLRRGPPPPFAARRLPATGIAVYPSRQFVAEKPVVTVWPMIGPLLRTRRDRVVF
jgi:hypothetical protein